MKFFIFLILIIPYIVWADDVSVQLVINNNQITLDDQVEMEIQVNGAKSASNPKLIGAENFTIQSSGSSSQIQIINGKTSIAKTFQVILTPKKEGEFSVGPAIVSVDGKEYRSQPVTIKVTKEVNNTNRNRESNANKKFFIESVVNKTSPFENEQFLYTFRLYALDSIDNASLDFPEFKGFWKEKLGDQKKYEKNINGINWHVVEISYLLTALKPGKLIIEEAKLTGEIIVENNRRPRTRSVFDQFFSDGFGERKRIKLVAKAIPIDVKPLPNPRPENFSGIVGSFTLKSEVDKPSVKYGDSVTLTVRLAGYGSLENASLPSEESEDFKVYDDKPTLDKNITPSGVVSSKTFKRAIIAKKEGKLVYPSIKIPVFDPTLNNYKTIETNPITLDVLPGDKDDINHTATNINNISNKKNVELIGQDLMPIRYNLDSLNSSLISKTLKIIFILIIFCCPLLYFVLYFVYKRKLEYSKDLGQYRKSKAAKEFLANFKQLSNSTKFMEDASNLVKDYLGNKFNVDGRAITQYDVERILAPLKISSNTILEIKNLFDQIEKTQYGGSSFSESSKNDLLLKIKNIFNSLEKEMK